MNLCLIICPTIMKDHTNSRQERQLIIILRWWVFLFIVAGLGFAIIPNVLIDYINILGLELLNWNAPPLQIPQNTFWLVLAISLMIVLIISAYKAQKDIVNNIFLVQLIVISKLASTLGYLLSFLLLGYSFAYIVGCIVDGSILAITFIAYKRVIMSRDVK